ncbi:MAG: cytochrome c oxidase subunit 3 [Phycisphaerales bacterium]|nr:cytochrome c oxidase subunit 3 [Phycisphaerales bacterium]
MTTLDVRQHGQPYDAPPSGPLWSRYKHAHHYRSAEEEFDAVKLGMWLFLATEVLLFAGLFCAYAVFRMLYPQAFYNGSHYLDWKWGGFNTVILLISSYTMAMSIRNCQRGEFRRMRLNLAFTIFCGALFVLIKLVFEYTPKWSGYFFVLDPALHHYADSGKTALFGLFHYVDGYGGKRPGMWFNYAFASDPYEPLWWGVYYSATSIHALHVLIGMTLIGRVLLRSFKGHYGPSHYTAVEISGLYWHLVDLIWIFLFPLLYLIH